MIVSRPSSLREAGQRIWDQLRELRLAKEALPESTQAERNQQRMFRRESEARLRPVIDAACQQWIEDGTVPLMSSIHASHVWDRFEQAHRALVKFSAVGFQVESQPSKQLLTFFLIEFWAEWGHWRS